MMKRRSFVQASLALGPLGGLLGCASNLPDKAKVVVIGGGFAGATAAKYVRILSDYRIDVVLVEPNASFISCPTSNLVIGGSRSMADITTPYDNLSDKHGVIQARDRVKRINTARMSVELAGGSKLAYDKLIVAPGVDFLWDSIEGLQHANAEGQILHAWKAGAETVTLRRQLESMPDGGVYAISVPLMPYRCPPGPYERASQVAHYFKQAKPRSKVLILDANPKIVSKGALFSKFWADNYPGMIEFRGNHKAVAVDGKIHNVKFEGADDVRVDVLNVVPNMSAGSIAMQSGLANVNNRWCQVDFLTFESTAAKDVHIIGDAVQSAPGMPKSGHMANSHGKVVAAAIVAQLAGLEVNPNPMLTNTCYSFVNDKLVVHVASVHQYHATENTYKTVAGSGGLSTAPNELEGVYAWNWAQNIWADTLL